MRVLWVVGVVCAALFSGAAFAKSKGDVRVQISMPEAKLYKSADYEGEVVRTAKAGDTFVSVSDYKGFYLLKDPITGDFLYVPSEHVVLLGVEPPKKLLIGGYNMKNVPNERDLSYFQVVETSSYRGGGDGRSSDLMKMRSRSKGGYDVAPNGKKYPSGYYRNDGTDAGTVYRPRVSGAQMVRDAKKYLGAPYVLGGTSTSGIDCSGLTQVCLKNQGIDVVHRSSLQALEGRYVNYTDLQPGDLVFFRDDDDQRYLSHVGIYVGSGKFIHASQGSGRVVVTSLSSKYFKQHYAFARRL